MTVRAGRILFDPSGLSMTGWQKARKQYFTPPKLGAIPRQEPTTIRGIE
jgi:hypothetical protein